MIEAFMKMPGIEIKFSTIAVLARTNDGPTTSLNWA
jgi:hypothetical protein